MKVLSTGNPFLSSMPVKYANFKVSEELAKRVREIVDSGILGYRSPNEFVNEAVRRRVEELLRMVDKPRK